MSTSLEIDRLIERQLRNWELARQQRAAEAVEEDPDRVEAFVAFSREVGCDAAVVARLLGDHLGWPVFDKELLHAMAGDDAVRRKLYERMDERDTNWLERVLRVLLWGDFTRDDYFRRLTETVLALARQGRAIFVGRGAEMILPAQYGLRVRLAAPLETRADMFARRHNIDPKAAQQTIAKLTRERTDFIRRHFRCDFNDASRFDMTVNVAAYPPEQAVELILTAMRLRKLSV